MVLFSFRGALFLLTLPLYLRLQIYLQIFVIKSKANFYVVSILISFILLFTGIFPCMLHYCLIILWNIDVEIFHLFPKLLFAYLNHIDYCWYISKVISCGASCDLEEWWFYHGYPSPPLFVVWWLILVPYFPSFFKRGYIKEVNNSQVYY